MKRSITGNPYVKNYDFDFNFGPPWGNCSVTMTSVIGHLNELRFPARYKQWHSPPPSSLFDAPVEDVVNKVSFLRVCRSHNLKKKVRTRKLSPITSHNKPNTLGLFSSGLIAIERVSTLVRRCDEQLSRAIDPWK